MLREAMSCFPLFDAAVFLTAGIGERKRRLAQREEEYAGSSDISDQAVVRDPEAFLGNEAILRQLVFEFTNAVVSDTANMSAEALLELGKQHAQPEGLTTHYCSTNPSCRSALLGGSHVIDAKKGNKRDCSSRVLTRTIAREASDRRQRPASDWRGRSLCFRTRKSARE
jgi:hypothetical protein